MTSNASVGIITGGASGMGLAVVENLVAKGWNITIFDFDQAAGTSVAERLGSQVLFVKGNVVKYDEQVAAFAETWKKWGRVDFVYANAGIGDKINFYEPQEELPNGGPPQPNTLVVDICLYGVLWSTYLALHYFRKNSSKGGALVMTSSEAGLYPSGPIPLYAAAKHGVVGLTRAMGQRLSQMGEPITINCVCPGLVPTGLVPQTMVDAMPAEMRTPTSTIVKAIDGFLADSSITGQVAECSGTEVIYRPPYEPGNEAARFLLGGSFFGKVNPEEVLKFNKTRTDYYDTME